VNLTYGAKITLPETGVILNNQMDDFSAQPGMPNAFGLVGSEANAIAPGKRPLSSMAPTIVAREGRPILILGGAGGPVIITAVFQVITNALDFGMELDEAQDEPRFHHQYRPNVIIVEDEVPLWDRLALFAKTWRPVVRSSRVVNDRLGRVNAIAWSEKKQAYIGVADPRGRGGAAAY
jgi:gamma-glutamyltranspeptidase/glutathione hydrolase